MLECKCDRCGADVDLVPHPMFPEVQEDYFPLVPVPVVSVDTMGREVSMSLMDTREVDAFGEEDKGRLHLCDECRAEGAMLWAGFMEDAFDPVECVAAEGWEGHTCGECKGPPLNPVGAQQEAPCILYTAREDSPSCQWFRRGGTCGNCGGPERMQEGVIIPKEDVPCLNLGDGESMKADATCRAWTLDRKP